MAIQKSEGVTPTERLLAELCERSFLNLWSYPNPWKDDRTEFCDLIAVFEGHVFIFFDRESRQLDNTDKDPDVAWHRWKRAAIDAQIRTVRGAERYLRSGRALHLDNALTTRLPIDIDPAKMIVHKIIVAHGAVEACKAASAQNVTGSLAICYGSAEDAMTMPFIVELDRDNPVHVLDSHTLPIILGELDTVKDLTDYLDAKIEAVKKYEWLVYCGEEDLLAHYFAHFDEKKKRHFIGARDRSVNAVMVGEGEYQDFIARSAYQRKKEADRASYFWDHIIQKTAQNQLDGTLLGRPTFKPDESAIHVMAKEPRFSRRALAEHMERSIDNFPKTGGPFMRYLQLMPSYYKGTGYVFLQVKATGIGDYDNDYRPKRSLMLRIAVAAAKNKMPGLTTIVGIAIDAPKFAGDQNSEDFALLRCAEWPEEDRARADADNEPFGFFKTGKLVRKKVKNFPDPPRARPAAAKVGRNDPCPCGSGLKFKRCCLARSSRSNA